ncbi:alpha-ketoacid dehydrogenase subunit alpha/beta [Solitalea koreensis]|uniref:3-methyl-2-oxobutanoate dehydrogenase (2-methylpropanoyl-transferring) n=1 Tax=Solitalea koreensis TaxID=543615 RepID=A0A521E7D9_9SPHI|nr:alpha-ketoacid dehydrogenase subunit alpha/beta [Solitalea koreensis]SMO79809.1 Pyruvate/2-oxoglutarate/acetoin dehydrogenase complex, dehydrogenase (E1) component [Solitalea koreensis]
MQNEVNKNESSMVENKELNFSEFREVVLDDYRLVNESRQASLFGRKEVLTGKAKFGIFGDGKELAQIAMAKVFKNGDFRSGYYRDQTFHFAAGIYTIKEFFAQLYAHADVNFESSTAGRGMTCHFGTRSLNEDGSWKNLTEMKNSSADISCTAGQMIRLVGLAQASKLYRENKELAHLTQFSNNGNEIAFGTIGDASTSEGHFYEAINAVGVLQVPMLMSVWDDGYGISVSQKYQTTKQNISEILKGFQRDEHGEGYEILRVKGWDYAALCETYEQAAAICREHHRPVLVHVQEVTQPQGHSTSGSHERYKSRERLDWEANHDCIKKMREWIINSAIATAEELDAIEDSAKKHVRDLQKEAWADFNAPIKQEIIEVAAIFDEIEAESSHAQDVKYHKNVLKSTIDPTRKDIISNLRRVLRAVRNEKISGKQKLINWYTKAKEVNKDRYNTFLFTDTDESALKVQEVKPIYDETTKNVDGREILQACFDAAFARDPRLVAFGEDVGRIGDVNQGFAGLQEKYGENRIFDVGIREATIMGQGIGLAMRGLRPIAEIQYLDYIYYGLQPLADDVSSLSYRTKRGQKAPLIVRTRGHRLEGIWHAGSPIGTLINALRGMHLLVPRNMTQAAGFYNTLIKADEPALVIECLNGYRLKEKLPANIGEFTTPLGVPEVLIEGTDITLVTYGSCVRIAEEAALQLAEVGISVELVDVQSLLPFDIHHKIVESLKKTNRIIFLDEDMPGGATAFMMQQVIEVQKGYYYLDTEPRTITAKEHRPAYGSDGDYFSKPSVEDVFDAVYEMMQEVDSSRFPGIY